MPQFSYRAKRVGPKAYRVDCYQASTRFPMGLPTGSWWVVDYAGPDPEIANSSRHPVDPASELGWTILNAIQAEFFPIFE